MFFCFKSLKKINRDSLFKQKIIDDGDDFKYYKKIKIK